MTVKFRDTISATMHNRVSSLPLLRAPFRLQLTCHISTSQKVQGRFFAGRRVEAYLFTGQQWFKRLKGDDNDTLGDGAKSERKRLDDFSQWLMDEGEA